MPYANRFIANDNLIVQLRPVIAGIANAAILSSYAGFLSVSAVTVYELAIKDIFNEFATKKNKVFGVFTESYFEKINGQIKLGDLRGKHISKFGDKYKLKFDSLLNTKDAAFLISHHATVSDAYSNLILCRHGFVHGGATTMTANEVMDAYELGKEVIHCLNDAMRR